MQRNIAVGLVLFTFSTLSHVNSNSLAPGKEQQVRFLISPNPALMDDRVAIKATGLPPNRSMTMLAASKDQRGCWWRSSAVFLTRRDGSFDLSVQAPTSGLYKGVDAMGLFWSMQPDKSVQPVHAFFEVVDWFKPIVTEIEAVSDGRVLGTSQVIRQFTAPGVRAGLFRSNGVVGILYRPSDDREHPGVILLGGSEGGFPAPQGAMLASRGFVVLALAYFGTNGLPTAMQRISVEYFGKAIHAMQSLPGVLGSGISIIGSSRGA